MNRLPIGVLALGVGPLLAGCAQSTSGPQPQDREVFVNFTNGVNESQALELWVGEGTPLRNVTVHRTSGETYNVTEGTAGISTTGPGVNNDVQSLTFPERATLYGRDALDPGATRTWTMPEPYAETTFAVVVYGDDGVRVRKSLACGDTLYGFGVETTDYGVAGAYACH